MKGRYLLVGLILILSTGLAACQKKKYLHGQHVLDQGQGRFWVSGSEGFAAFFDGQKYQRRDYPLDSDAPDWAYEGSGSFQASTVIASKSGTIYLFTRIGDALRWTDKGWQRIQAHLVPEEPFYRQLNRVLLAPDGRFLFQLHSDILLWIAPDMLAAGPRVTEKTPTFFPWLGFIDGELFAVGWDETGNISAIQKRTGPNSWVRPATLPDLNTNHPKGVARLKNGQLSMVTLGGLWRKLTPEANSYAPDPKVAKGIKPQAGFVDGFAQVPKRGLFLLTRGGVLQVGKTYATWWPCPESDELFIGALSIPAGIRLVGRYGSVWDLVDGKYTQRHPKLLAH